MSKAKNKEKKHSFIRVSKNLWFMLKYSFKYAPSYTLVTLGERLDVAHGTLLVFCLRSICLMP